MQATAPDLVRAVQSTTGRTFQLRTASPRDWAGQWPTDRSGEILVSEMPGNCDGSVFAYWVGNKTLACPGVLPAIQAHVDDHDVVGLCVIYALPDDAHSSLRADLAELKQRAASEDPLAVREGIRVRIKAGQNRIGGDKYPGREGVVQSKNGVGNDCWYVRLAPTARAQGRDEMFSADVFDVLTTLDDIATLPPLSGEQFAHQLDQAGSLVFAGASYTLRPHQVAGLPDGWAVNATYPDGSSKMFGQNHPLTRSLALHLAACNAMDWWLNRRAAQAQVALR